MTTFIGIITFNTNIDKLSKTKKDSLKKEIYNKIFNNEHFIKNISIDKSNIKLKGNKAIVPFSEKLIPNSEKYQKKTKMVYNWVFTNFRKSINRDKKLFLDESLKALKVELSKSKSHGKKKKTRKRKKKGGSGNPTEASRAAQSDRVAQLSGPKTFSQQTLASKSRNIVIPQIEEEMRDYPFEEYLKDLFEELYRDSYNETIGERIAGDSRYTGEMPQSMRVNTARTIQDVIESGMEKDKITDPIQEILGDGLKIIVEVENDARAWDFPRHSMTSPPEMRKRGGKTDWSNEKYSTFWNNTGERLYVKWRAGKSAWSREKTFVPDQRWSAVVDFGRNSTDNTNPREWHFFLPVRRYDTKGIGAGALLPLQSVEINIKEGPGGMVGPGRNYIIEKL